MSVELAPKTNNNSEKQPGNSEPSKGEDFSWFEEHPHSQGFGDKIEDRLTPEPLSEERKEELLRLANSNESAEATLGFVEEMADLTPEQRNQFEDYRENISLLDLKEKDPKAFEEKISTFSDVRRSEFNVLAEQAAEDKAKLQQNIAERRANPQAEDDTDNLLLYSQKLQDPKGFQENYKSLDTKQQVKFSMLERDEDKRTRPAIEAGPHDISVPELTMDGEAWVKEPGHELAERAAKITSPEDFFRFQEMEATDPERFTEIRRMMTPDQLSAFEANKKINEINLGGGSVAEVKYGDAYRESERISPEDTLSPQTQERMEQQAESAIKASKPGVWSKVKRWFKRKK